MSKRPHIEARYDPCLLLEQNGIPYVVWFEDALHYYGVPTVVFSLCLLVLDMDIAADCLQSLEWVADMQCAPRIGNAEVENPRILQLQSPSSDTELVLLKASDWKFSLSADSILERPTVERVLGGEGMESRSSDKQLSFPRLPDLLNSLIESWLVEASIENPDLSIHLAVQFSYLYEYVPTLKERSFAEQLKYEHHQFHYDVLAGMDTGTIPFREHQRTIRDALLRDEYELRDCSAPDNKDLFDPWHKIRQLSPEATADVEEEEA
ncbi:uncharacterized protein BDV14DRAFT_208818 [Aspergillus stella-maris]|uniref:uncharacterized protein n=1 Tax=Aspergillus stella-maris TaxID=1810926 RepID=UPI003CCCDA87